MEGAPTLLDPFAGMFQVSPAIITSLMGSSGFLLIVLPRSESALIIILSLISLKLPFFFFVDNSLLSCPITVAFVFVRSCPATCCPNVVLIPNICLIPFKYDASILG